MKRSQVILMFGILMSLAAITAVNGFRFYDILEPRAVRWPPRETISTKPLMMGKVPQEEDYYRLISYLNDVGKRRR